MKKTIPTIFKLFKTNNKYTIVIKGKKTITEQQRKITAVLWETMQVKRKWLKGKPTILYTPEISVKNEEEMDFFQTGKSWKNSWPAELHYKDIKEYASGRKKMISNGKFFII